MPGEKRYQVKKYKRERLGELSKPLLSDGGSAGVAESKNQSKASFNGLLDHTTGRHMLFLTLGSKEVRQLRAVSTKAKASAEDFLTRQRESLPLNGAAQRVYAHAYSKLNDLHGCLCFERVRLKYVTDNIDCVSGCCSCCGSSLLIFLLLGLLTPRLQHIFGLSAVLLGNVVVSAAVPSLCWGAYSLMALFNRARYRNPCLDGLSDNLQAAIKDTLGRCTSIETGRCLEIKGLVRLNTLIKLCERYQALYSDKMAGSLADRADQAGRDTAHHEGGSGSGAALVARAAGGVDALGGGGQRRSASEKSDDDQREHAAGTGGAGAYADGATGVVVTFASP